MASLVRNAVLGIAIIIFAGYLLFQLQGFLFGSSLAVYAPSHGDHLMTSHVVVRGKATGMAFLSLDGSPIFTDDEGFFQEKLILPYGLNIIRITGEGKFGRSFHEERMVYVSGRFLQNNAP